METETAAEPTEGLNTTNSAHHDSPRNSLLWAWLSAALSGATVNLLLPVLGRHGRVPIGAVVGAIGVILGVLLVIRRKSNHGAMLGLGVRLLVGAQLLSCSVILLFGEASDGATVVVQIVVGIAIVMSSSAGSMVHVAVGCRLLSVGKSTPRTIVAMVVVRAVGSAVFSFLFTAWARSRLLKLVVEAGNNWFTRGLARMIIFLPVFVALPFLFVAARRVERTSLTLLDGVGTSGNKNSDAWRTLVVVGAAAVVVLSSPVRGFGGWYSTR